MCVVCLYIFIHTIIIKKIHFSDVYNIIDTHTNTCFWHEIVWSIRMNVNDNDVYKFKRKTSKQAKHKQATHKKKQIWYIWCNILCSQMLALLFFSIYLSFFLLFTLYEYLIYDGFWLKTCWATPWMYHDSGKKTTIMSFVRQQKKFRLVIYGARVSLHSSYE